MPDVHGYVRISIEDMSTRISMFSFDLDGLIDQLVRLRDELSTAGVATSWSNDADGKGNCGPVMHHPYGVIDDGYGNVWPRCKPDCGLEIVRIGKVQCECEDE